MRDAGRKALFPTGSLVGGGWNVTRFDWASLGTYRSLEIDRRRGDACIPTEQ